MGTDSQNIIDLSVKKYLFPPISDIFCYIAGIQHLLFHEHLTISYGIINFSISID